MRFFGINEVKKMKKSRRSRRINKKRIVIGFLLFHLFFGIFAAIAIKDVNSWSNGTGLAKNDEIRSYSGTKRTGVNYWNHDSIDSQNWFKYRFGTHDWIGYGALSAVARDGGSDWTLLGKEFWTERRQWIFLVGTEAPDAGTNELSIQLNDGIHYGMWTKNLHHIYFRDDTEYPSPYRMHPMPTSLRPCMVEITRLTGLVITAFELDRCDTAAFLMGAICHFIGDMACFVHVTEEDGVGDENKLETNVLAVTQYKDALNAATFMGEPFSYPTLGPNVGYTTPHAAVVETAFYTKFGVKATWDVIVDSSQNKPENLHADYTAEDCVADLHRATGLGINRYPTRLLETIQNQLQEAVRQSARMINFFEPMWKSVCDNDDDDDNDGENNYPGGGGGQQISQNIVTGLMFSLSIGISTVILAPMVQIWLTKLKGVA